MVHIDRQVRLLASIALAVVGMLFAVRLGVANDNPTTTVLLNAQVADGTGKPVHKANVRISGDRIVRVGTFRPDRGETIIDAKGLVVAPGFIDTDMTRALPDDQREALLQRIPLQRLGMADEIAAAVAFLASDAAAYITGQTLHVNGGMYMC